MLGLLDDPDVASVKVGCCVYMPSIGHARSVVFVSEVYKRVPSCTLRVLSERFCEMYVGFSAPFVANAALLRPT